MLDGLLQWAALAVKGPPGWQGAIAALAMSFMSPEALPNPSQHGNATRFGDEGDRWIGGTLKCRPDEYVNADEHMCAHRSYPCGSILILRNPRTHRIT